MTNSNICSGCYNHCFIKPRDVDDDTEDNNRNKELKHTLEDLDIGILLSALVRLADSCESDEEEMIEQKPKNIKISISSKSILSKLPFPIRKCTA